MNNAKKIKVPFGVIWYKKEKDGVVYNCYYYTFDIHVFKKKDGGFYFNRFYKLTLIK